MDIITVKLEEKQRMQLSDDIIIPSIEGIKISSIISIVDLDLITFNF